MGAHTDKRAVRTLGLIEAELRSAATARRLAEDDGLHDIAALLGAATDLGLDELNSLKNA